MKQTTQAEISTTPTLSCSSTGANAEVIALIVTVIITTMLATVIMVLQIPLYVRYKRLLTLTSQNVSKETAARNELPEDATYEQIDETKFGKTVVDLKQNEAYGMSRVTA